MAVDAGNACGSPYRDHGAPAAQSAPLPDIFERTAIQVGGEGSDLQSGAVTSSSGGITWSTAAEIRLRSRANSSNRKLLEFP